MNCLQNHKFDIFTNKQEVLLGRSLDITELIEHNIPLDSGIEGFEYNKLYTITGFGFKVQGNKVLFIDELKRFVPESYIELMDINLN